MSEKMTEKSFRLNRYATGNYFNKCVVCGDEFIGDKRANHCLDCDIKTTLKTITALQRENKRLRGDMVKANEALNLAIWSNQVEVAMNIIDKALKDTEGE